MLTQARITNNKNVDIPVEINVKLVTLMVSLIYCQLVGRLVHLIITPHYISYAVHLVI